MSRKFEPAQYATAASPDVSIKCGRCKQEFPYTKPSKVRGYRFIIQSEDRPVEYAAGRAFFCDPCINEILVESEKMIGATMDINSPLARLRFLGCDRLDSHNEAVRKAVDNSQLYKSADFLEGDLPMMPTTKIVLNFPEPKKRGFIRRFFLGDK